MNNQPLRQRSAISSPFMGRVREKGHPQPRPSANSSVQSILIAILLATLALSPAPTRAQTSLFFTQEETQAIESLAQTEKQKSPDAPTSDISLDAILYYSPHDWKIWLQGEPWTPETSPPGIRILKVSPDRVTLKIALNPPVRIALKPHQTWSIANHNTSETENNDNEE